MEITSDSVRQSKSVLDGAEGSRTLDKASVELAGRKPHRKDSPGAFKRSAKLNRKGHRK